MRRLSLSAAFQDHLTQCMVAEIWNEQGLSVSQILGRTALEIPDKPGDPRDQALHAAVVARRPAEVVRRRIDRPPPTFDNDPKPIW